MEGELVANLCFRLRAIFVHYEYTVPYFSLK